jgi:ATP-dependent helicase/nuclease subunit A
VTYRDRRSSEERDQLDVTTLVLGESGTGRTQFLVDRAVALVRTGRAAPGDIAIVVATEADAGLVRRLLRTELARAGAGSELPVVDTALGFALRILDRDGGGVGVAPGIALLDAAADHLDFEDRVRRYATDLFGDEGAKPHLLRAFSLGLTPENLRAMARELHEGRHLLTVSPDRGTDLDVESDAPRSTPSSVERVRAALRDAVSMRARCDDPDDLLARHLDALAVVLAELDACPDDQSVLQFLDTRRSFACALGQQARWAGRVDDVRGACSTAESARRAMLDAAGDSSMRFLRARLSLFVTRVGEARRRQGRLGRLDVLVLARRLLHSDPSARESLAHRYACVFVDALDEKLEAEVARLTFESLAEAQGRDPSRPGSVWIHGRGGADPPSVHREIRLDVNHRSVPGLVQFVHAIVGPVEACPVAVAARRPMPLVWRPPGRIASGRGAASGTARESAQLALGDLDAPAAPDAISSARDASAGTATTTVTGSGVAPVVVVGGPMRASNADVGRALARGAADAVVEVVRTGWAVLGDDGRYRRATWRDVAVLLCEWRAMASLEEALEAAGVPVHTEEAGLAWRSEDVRDVLAVLRAVDDPTDAVAVLAALRVPALGCGDDDLVIWHRDGGAWDPRAPVPPALGPHPVARAMDLIARLHEVRWWEEPSGMVSRVLDELKSPVLCLARAQPADHVERLRFLVDRARLFDETTGGSLRGFLEFATLECDGALGDAGATVGPPDTDADAVRLMTSRACGGQEFPIVVVAGLEPETGGRRVVAWDPDGFPEIGAGRALRTSGYDGALTRRREHEATDHRALVRHAMTRARDHLVVCVHHRERDERVGLAPDFSEACTRHPSLWRRLPVDAAASATSCVTLSDTERIGSGSSRHVDGSTDIWGTLRHGAADEELDAWETACRDFASRRSTVLDASRSEPPAAL